mmetsp:Transcript_68872/g.164312  ORF Transcript_68872/g.164312 Transcript_68872/m.164312 type:complete len:167 (+) Transcript_68872:20-520(+)|eukprot:CAMPEP_0180151334 /NCGR_PEP_ID=MMETSP0986-20121125/22064_1 /TAXON_ID=697907 /ORGANISM="non described non described, Strain CCMP2293" /LENGTH=166 /DNA_ID=CAMNT_0022098603 /DNA_START=20 /DNA_END=520 /DNA_ORIENTATION=-
MAVSSGAAAMALLFLAAAAPVASAFVPGLRPLGLRQAGTTRALGTCFRRPHGGAAVLMKDHSSVTEFSANDRVEVTAELSTRGGALKGMVGTIVETWEKCEVDPICCCAENGMEEASVEVSFTAPEMGDAFSRFDLSEKERAQGRFSSFFSAEELSLVTRTVTVQS